MRTTKQRPVALLDVDDTLIFGTREFNETLVESLLKSDIKDIYLFTHMRFNRTDIKERMDLIQTLTNKGFTVHGVMTLADLFWTGKLGDAKPGEAFEAAKNSLGTLFDKPLTLEEMGIPLSKELVQKREVAVNSASDFAKKEDYKHAKGLLLGLFLDDKPDWVSSIYIADDRQEVIRSVEQYVERKQPDISISTQLVKPNLTDADYQTHQNLLKVVEALKSETTTYQTYLNESKNPKDNAIKEIVSALNSILDQKDLTANNKIIKFYSNLTDENINTIKKNAAIPTKNLLKFFAIVAATLLTGILPGLLVTGVVYATTGKKPSDLLTTPGRQFKEKLTEFKEAHKDLPSTSMKPGK